ncbi:MAG: thiolase family protein [Deltaproteobacteria bacterium]|nr:thiolase family protein [Deltaproteobacteria bacterium]MBW2362331.1 thiolase family protein [Deltaproteobacteria bacterium]
MQLRNVVLVDGARSAFARGARGKLVATRLDEVGAQVLRALLDRHPKVTDQMIEDVGVGMVAGGPNEFHYVGNIQRLAGLPLEACTFHSNRQCGSSMETLQRIAMSIMIGTTDCGIAMGAERMGRVLGGGGGEQTRVNTMTKKVAELNAAQLALAPDHDEYFSVEFPEYIRKSPWLQAMTQTAQNVAEVYGLSREELDQYAVDSHAKGHRAYESGFYKDEVVPLEVEDPVFDDEGKWVEAETGPTVTFDRDECIRAGTTLEKLAKLKPLRGVVSFDDNELVISAGNACPTNDGVSATLLMSEEKALALGLEPLARIVGMGVGGVKPQLMGLGPVVSSKKAFRHAGIEAGQIDRVEFNEAFSAQVIPSLRELGIPADRVNTNGGSLGIGHPLGATGARLVTTVAKELRRSGGRYGLATQCIGAGMGISTVLERLD